MKNLIIGKISQTKINQSEQFFIDEMDSSGLEYPAKSASTKFRVKKCKCTKMYKQFSKYLAFVDSDHSSDGSVQIAVRWLYYAISMHS